MGEQTRGQKKVHKNDEKQVRCPVEGCDKVVLARALHLHVGRKSGNGHGPSGTVPDDVDLDSAEEAGTREVEMEYPERRDTEDAKRLCPYCERPFDGKQGVMVHLGATAGRKNHPEDAAKRHDINDFPVARVDDNQNVIEVIDSGTKLPATEDRQEVESDQAPLTSVSEADIRQHIEDLREQGLDEQADQAEQMLLGE